MAEPEVAVLVPRRRDGGRRDRLWAHACALWAELFTRAESDAWARSPEGRATFAELLGGNRAQRRAEQRRRKGTL